MIDQRLSMEREMVRERERERERNVKNVVSINTFSLNCFRIIGLKTAKGVRECVREMEGEREMERESVR
jgi:hypothetical protein